MAELFGGNAWKSSEYRPDGKFLVVTIANVNGDVFIDDSIGNRININGVSQYILHNGDILVSLTGNVGRVSRATGKALILNQRVGKIIPSYNQIDTDFLFSILRSSNFENNMIEAGQGAAQKNIGNRDVLEYQFRMPIVRSEQVALGKLFCRIDSLLSLHQRKPFGEVSSFSKRQNVSWEQRKFSELVLIERGGSPRPIDNYITDAPDGLNWVKIGDAPAQGRYIFKTAEKIKPQGLSKTRQVQPGDLILSNSMSFGKPYIMGIHGCIHDGWLLIRDTGAKFDSKFLCHLLGSNQMLEQYRMFAAGSTVNNLNKELVGNTTVHIPVIQEQRVIGESLESIDKCISLHHRQCLTLAFHRIRRFFHGSIYPGGGF
mgnify:CR=1 FL=1